MLSLTCGLSKELKKPKFTSAVVLVVLFLMRLKCSGTISYSSGNYLVNAAKVARLKPDERNKVSFTTSAVTLKLQSWPKLRDGTNVKQQVTTLSPYDTFSTAPFEK